MRNQQKRVVLVLERLINLIKEDESLAEACSEYLDNMLQDLHGYDIFGTEGQRDPRGDFRDWRWSIYNVQGVDD